MHSGFASLRSALPMNLNRVFPGRPEGSFSERVAYHLFERARLFQLDDGF